MSHSRSIMRLALVAGFALASVPGGATVLRFDGLTTGDTEYEERGFSLSSSATLSVDPTTAPDPPAFYPGFDAATMVVERVSGRPFDAHSLGVREINSGLGSVTIEFTGELFDGGTVTHVFQTDGICCSGEDFGFETAHLPDTFRALRSLTWQKVAGIPPVFDTLVLDVPGLSFDGFDLGATSWVEDGFVLDSALAIFGDEFSTPDPPSIFPSNVAQTFSLRSANGGVFDLIAFETRELNDTLGPVSNTFLGFADGALPLAEFTTDGVCCVAPGFGFETVVLPASFRQLFGVEWDGSLLNYDTFEAVLVAPSNDVAESASGIDPPGAVRRGTLVRATNDAAVSFAGSEESPDVWYSLTPVTDTEYQIHTCEGNLAEEHPDPALDSVISVHDALPASDANLVAANDEAQVGSAAVLCAGRRPADSALRVEVVGGSTVWIRVSQPGDVLESSDFFLHVPEPGAGLAGAAALAALAATRRRRRAPRGA